MTALVACETALLVLLVVLVAGLLRSHAEGLRRVGPPPEGARPPGAPYFVYVEAGRVSGEGAATGWDQLASLLRDALDDARLAQQRPDAEPGPDPGGAVAAAGGQERALRADRALQSAGIGPGHPS